MIEVRMTRTETRRHWDLPTRDELEAKPGAARLQSSHCLRKNCVVAMPVVSCADDELRFSFALLSPEIDVDSHVHQVEPIAVDVPIALKQVELNCGVAPD